MHFGRRSKIVVLLLIINVQQVFPMGKGLVKLGALARRAFSTLVPTATERELRFFRVPQKIKLILFNATPLLPHYQDYKNTMRRLEWQYATACTLSTGLKYLIEAENKEVGFLFESEHEGDPSIYKVLEAVNFEEGFVVDNCRDNKVAFLSQVHNIPSDRILLIGWDGEHLEEARTGPLRENPAWTMGIYQPDMTSEELGCLADSSITFADNVVEGVLTAKTFDIWVDKGMTAKDFSSEGFDGQDD